MKRSNRFLVCEKLERNQAHLLDTAMSFTKDIAEAQDLLQQTSLVILANADNYEEMGCFIGWATKIMRNIHLNNEEFKKVRKKMGYDDIPADDPNVAVCENDETCYCRDVYDFIAAGLPTEQADAISLAFEGYSYNEIANEVSTTPGTVKNRIHAARTILRKEFGD